MLSLICSLLLFCSPMQVNDATQLQQNAVTVAWPKIRTEIHGRWVYVYWNDVLVLVTPLPTPI
mgnify:CR=1 FL=1